MSAKAKKSGGDSPARRKSREIILRKKSDRKKSLSEIVNAQLDREYHHEAEDPEEDNEAVLEEYDMLEEGGGNDDDVADLLGMSDSRNPRKRSRDLTSSSAGSTGLRRRGPLDESLSSGKYAATARDMDSAMDDLFGGLDMGDLDDEANALVGDSGEDEDLDEDDGDSSAAKGRKKSAKKGGKRVKDLSANEYIEYMEKKAPQLRKKTSAASGLRLSSHVGDEGEDDILEQLEELRAQQIQLVQTDGDSAATGVEEAERRQRIKEAVRHYLVLFSHLLRIRVKLQPAVVKAISMPQYYSRSLFTGKTREMEGKEAKEVLQTRKQVALGYKAVRKELENILANLYADASQLAVWDAATPAIKKRRVEDSTEGSAAVPSFDALQSYHRHILQQAKATLLFWGSRFSPSAAEGRPLQTIHQPILTQIDALLHGSKSRLRMKVQKNRSHLPVVAHPEHVRASPWFYSVAETDNAELERRSSTTALEAAKTFRASRIAEGDVDEEIYDDGEFLRELVRRGGSVAAQLDRQLQDMSESLLPNKKEGAKKGFHRLTKGKALDFTPRPKLVGFMVAESFDTCHPPRSEVVVRSLFQ